MLPRQRIWEGVQLGQLTPTDQRNIPGHTASWSAYWAGEGADTHGVRTFVFPSRCSALRSLSLLRMVEHLPAHGEKCINSYFPLFALAAFALPIQSLSKPLGLHTFSLLTLSPIPPGGSEQVAAWGWASYWG